METGKLDRRIILQRKSVVNDEYGEAIETWAEIATVWAQKLDMRGTERYTAVQTVAEIDTKFRIHYRSGLTPIDRVSYDSRLYDIGGVLEIGRKAGIELHAKARAE